MSLTFVCLRTLLQMPPPTAKSKHGRPPELRISPFELRWLAQEGTQTCPKTLSIYMCGILTSLIVGFFLPLIWGRVFISPSSSFLWLFHIGSRVLAREASTAATLLGTNWRGDVRASLLSTEVACLMSNVSYQRNGFTAFDILLLELIRWLIIINTIFFCCCLHLIDPPLLYTLVSFKLSLVFWLL